MWPLQEIALSPLDPRERCWCVAGSAAGTLVPAEHSRPPQRLARPVWAPGLRWALPYFCHRPPAYGQGETSLQLVPSGPDVWDLTALTAMRLISSMLTTLSDSE